MTDHQTPGERYPHTGWTWVDTVLSLFAVAALFIFGIIIPAARYETEALRLRAHECTVREVARLIEDAAWNCSPLAYGPREGKFCWKMKVSKGDS